MPKLRVHELAKELDRTNREIIEFLKDKGVDIKSHMSTVDEGNVKMTEDAFKKSANTPSGEKESVKKEQEPGKAPEAEKKEAPKKKKNIIRVFHANNASDGGRGMKRERKPGQSRPGQPRPSQPRPGQPRPQQEPARSVTAQETGKSAPAPEKVRTEPAAQAKSQPAAPEKAQAPVKEAPQAAAQAKSQPTAQGTSQPAAQGTTQPQNRPASSNHQQGRPQGGQQQSGHGYQGRPQGGQYNQGQSGQGQNQRYQGQSGQGQRYQGQSGQSQGQRYQGQSGQGQRYQGQSGQGQGQRYQGQSGQGQQGQNRSSQNQGRYQGQGGSRPQGSGSGRPQGQNSRPGQGGQNRPYQGQGRPQNNAGGRPQGQNGNRPRPQGPGRDNNYAARGGQGQGRGVQPRKDSDIPSFTAEVAKSQKDTKRERDKRDNKKKEFDKTVKTSNRPNQGGGRRPNMRIPRALQRPVQQPRPEEKKPEIKEITIPEKLTIRELADKMKMQPSVIVKKLFLEGIMVTVNHEIEFEKAQEIAMEYDIIAELEEKVDVIEELLKEEDEDESELRPRPPVVCVMGHVDHGKTSLLDAIRNTNVTDREAGGITQHIGAYTVTINGEKITFLDTPGHEAFTAMRMRGANATDIAILVVAADDGVMPQTVEAISHAKAANTEIIVAVNKIDKPNANVERVKQELSEYELIPEDWGGSTIFVPVSAHTGDGIDTLLEMILLTAEVGELKANPKREARGLVIEAELDKGKGPVATILVQKGTLHVGDFIAAGSCHGKVRAMMDDKGRRVKEAGPSTPVEILGLSDVPNAGEIIVAFDSDKEAKSFAATFVSEGKNRLLEDTKAKLSLDDLFTQIQAGTLKELPIIVKADVQGSVEAVKQSLTKLSNEEVVVKMIHGGVGAINESDVSLASTSNAIIIGFNVRPDAMAKTIAEQEGVDMRLYKVIYQAIEDVEAAMKGMLDPVFEEQVIGHAEVRQTFKASGIGTIAGGYVLDGRFERNCKVRVSRGDDQIFEGALASLKRFKDDVKEVKAGFECGLVFENFNDVQVEDKVEAYIMVEVPR